MTGRDTGIRAHAVAAAEQRGPRRVRVAHLTSVHRPMDTRILHRECASLAAAGFDVTLIAAWPDSETQLAVTLNAVPRLEGKWRRLLRTVPAIGRTAWRSQHDLYHIHDPELLPVGLVLRLQGKSVVYDAHEDLPEQIRSKAWVPRPLRGPLARLGACCNWVAGRAFSGVVAATSQVSESFPAKRTCTVQNFPKLDELSNPDATPYAERKAVVAYIGDLTVIRGVKEATKAMALLPESLDARLSLAGTFSPEALKADIVALPGWDRVDWLGWQDRGGVKALLSEAKIGLVALHPVQNYREAQPVKLFEYMAAGLPVVASDFSQWRRFLDNGRAGVMVDPLDIGAIAGAIRWLLEHPEEAEAMGKRGQELVTKRFSWEKEAEKLVSFYNRILNAS